MPETGEKTGQVTRERFDQIIAELREEMETDRRIQFVVGDRALEVEPMRPAGGSPTAIGDLPTVSASLHLLAEESASRMRRSATAAGSPPAGRRTTAGPGCPSTLPARPAALGRWVHPGP
ncbi:hypothetical protein GCM10009837_40240 [Streptomyces durmitorensis]|uniref:Uncharacterized protein n=1 Tax=Streptomyces durmitorensis TaxID=319947 RepID=A0ABY4Q5K5_9ACTN|nr:hypothetical protein [Streptomyces durmitorensis]UQT60929.1 hypothetical protein M4V62_40905 [Streptomyces durmitorensis]